MLRSEQAQSALSQLAAIDKIHVIASIDHTNAPIIWDHTKLGLFRWSWFHCSTFEHATRKSL